MLEKYLVILLFLFGSYTYANGFEIIISPGGYQGIADAQGEVVIPAVYEQLGWSDGSSEILGDAIGYFENNRWGLINLKSKKLTSANYTILLPFDAELYEAGITGRFTNQVFRGLIDSKSKVLLDFKYFTIERIEEGKIIASEYIDGQLKYALLNRESEMIIPADFSFMRQMGMVVVAQGMQQKSRIFDLEGNLLIDRWIDQIQETPDGLLVSSEGYYGLLDLDGGYFHHIKYKKIDGERAESFPEWEIRSFSSQVTQDILCDSVSFDSNEGLLIAHVNNVEHILGASDKVFQGKNNSLKYIGQGFLVIKDLSTAKWAIHKTDGREVAANFDSVVVDPTFFYVLDQSKWKIYNRFGRQIGNRGFQELGDSHNGFIPVRFAGYWGWVDFQGDIIVKNKYDAVQAGMEDQFLAKNFGSWGIRQFYGDWLVMPRYDSIYITHELYFAQKGKATHVFDREGRRLFTLSDEVINTDLLLVKGDDHKFGLILSGGNYIEPIYEEIQKHGDFYELKGGKRAMVLKMDGSEAFGYEAEVQDVISFSEGYFHVIMEGKHGFVDTNGKLRIANRYDSAQFFNEGMAPVKLMGKWGFIGPYENLLIQPFYQYSSTFQEGLAIVQIDDLYGLLDKSGKEIIQIKWKKIERLATGNYLVIDENGKEGIANEHGRFLLRPNYNKITDTTKDLLIVNRSGKIGVMDYTGLQQIPFDYSEIKIEGDYILIRK
mgnify:CR=1 FL=1